MSKKYPPIRWWSDVATKIESGFANTAVKIEEGFAKLASTKNTSLGQRFRNFMGKGHSTMPWWFYFITLTGTNFFVISQIQRFVEYQEENHRQLLLDEFSEAKYAKALSNLYQFRKWFDKDNGANELPWVTKFKDCTGKDYRTDSDGYWKSGCDCSKGHSRCFWTKMQIYNQAHDLVPINSISKANKPQEDHDVLQTIDQSRRLLWIFGMRLYLTQHESKKVNCTTWAVNFLSGKNHESITDAYYRSVYGQPLFRAMSEILCPMARDSKHRVGGLGAMGKEEDMCDWYDKQWTIIEEFEKKKREEDRMKKQAAE